MARSDMQQQVRPHSLGIVDNDPLVSRALESMFIQSHAPVDIAWNVTDADQCVRLCLSPETMPDGVLVDIQMPNKDGKQLAEELRSGGYCGVILAMTAFQMKYSGQELADAGIQGVIRKEAGPEEYIHALGRMMGDADLTAWNEHSLAFTRMMLTDTELDVLRAYLRGNTTQTTARIMHMSEGTVKTHMRNAYRKMGVHCRAEAIRILVREHVL